MSKTTTTSILTVRELTPNPTLTNYSFVEALSDAGYSVYYDSDPEARGRPAGEKTSSISGTRDAGRLTGGTAKGAAGTLPLSGLLRTACLLFRIV